MCQGMACCLSQAAADMKAEYLDLQRMSCYRCNEQLGWAEATQCLRVLALSRTVHLPSACRCDGSALCCLQLCGCAYLTPSSLCCLQVMGSAHNMFGTLNVITVRSSQCSNSSHLGEPKLPSVQFAMVFPKCASPVGRYCI